MAEEIPMAVTVNCTTGEETWRPLTAEEIIENQARSVANELLIAEREAQATAKATAKASAEAKLAALGLTAEEIAAL